jgi:SAM-dependent methyltransferase
MAKTKKHKTLAKKADRYALYQRAVQSPEVEIEFFNRVYRKQFGKKPEVLREDFSGAAAISCHWVDAKKNRRAIAVDLDPEPLAWGQAHNAARLSPDARSRVEFRQADVLAVTEPKADVVAAQNFSFFVFKTRDELREYFRSAYQNLGDQGIFVLDMMGGPEVMVEDQTDRRKIKGAEYCWEQVNFDPITHHCTFHIHFRFKDGSNLKRAFSYDWRLWTVPETREVLLEAGFDQVDVYWEETDNDTGEGNGVYKKRTTAPSDACWVIYLVGTKKKAIAEVRAVAPDRLPSRPSIEAA